MCFKFKLKDLYRVRLSDVTREVIPKERGTVGKGPAENFFLSCSRDVKCFMVLKVTLGTTKRYTDVELKSIFSGRLFSTLVSAVSVA